MALTEKEQTQILERIKERAPHIETCPVCGNHTWQVQDNYILIPAPQEAGRTTLGESGLPCIPILCSNCGNTLLLNLIILGLRHLVENKAEVKMEVEKKNS